MHHEDVLLFLKYAAPYMVKAAKCIQVFYPKMMHITCVAHRLQKSSRNNIRGQFLKIDELIANNIKKYF